MRSAIDSACTRSSFPFSTARSLRGGAAHDGDALVEALAARLGRDVGVVLQRQVDDAPLDRGHGRQELFAAVAAHALGGVAGALREILVAPRLEAAAIELDVLLGLPSDEGLVREHLQRVERLAVLLDHAPRVAPVQAHDDLLLVLLGAHVEVEARVVDDLFAPLAHRLRGVRLLPLLRRLGRGELLEVARLQIVVATAVAARTARGTIVAAISAARAARSTAAAARSVAGRMSGDGDGDRRGGRSSTGGRGVRVYVCFEGY